MGDNDEGQLGNGASGADVPLGTYPKGSATPVEVTGLANIVDIGAGTKHASAGMAVGQGALSPDDPGGRNLLPMQVKDIADAQRLAIGGGNVAALLGDGSLRMWGHNGFGEMGTATPGSYATRPVKTALTNVVAVYLGNLRSCAVLSDGTFWIWGFGHSTAQGILATNLKVPTRLDLP